MFNYGNIFDENSLREHEINKLNNFICGFYVPQKTELISDIIIEMHNLDPTKSYEEIIDKETNQKLKTSENSTLIDNKIIEEIRIIMSRAITNYFRKYPLAASEDVMLYEMLKIRKYDNTVTFKSWKIDKVSDPEIYNSRHMSFMIFLNEPEDATVGFLHQNLGIKPKKGLIILYPSNWMFANIGQSLKDPMYMVTGHMSISDKVKNKPNDRIIVSQM